MHPILHVALTAALGGVLIYMEAFTLRSVAFAILLTVLVDAVDHGLTILYRNAPVAARVRDLIGKGETLRSYRYYYRHRYTLDFMPLHNVFFAGIVVVVLSLLNGDEVVAAVQLGLLFHLLCDMVDNVRTQGLRYIVDFWILNPLLVLMGRTREQGARR